MQSTALHGGSVNGAKRTGKCLSLYADVYSVHACLCRHPHYVHITYVFASTLHSHSLLNRVRTHSLKSDRADLFNVWELPTAPAAFHSCSGPQYRFCVAQYIAGCSLCILCEFGGPCPPRGSAPFLRRGTVCRKSTVP